MASDLAQVQSEARRYLDRLTSHEYLKQFSLTVALDVRYRRGIFEEAIVLLHVNPDMGPGQLSSILGIPFTHERMDVVTDFFLREVLFDRSKPSGRSWSGQEILSNKQLTRRQAAESFQLMELDYE
jgi:hypothetical protein